MTPPATPATAGTLEAWGWNAARAAEAETAAAAALAAGSPGAAVHARAHVPVPARIAAETKGGFMLWTASGECLGRLLGSQRRTAAIDPLARPAVGDWALVELVTPPERTRPNSLEDAAIIRTVLRRHTQLVRKAAGMNARPQIVAANVDTVFITADLAADANERRLERYAALVFEGGARPVVVLTKRDLVPDADARAAALATLLGLPVVALSVHTPGTLDALEPWLRAGETVAFVGSSGAGKSTLINALMGDAHLAAPLDVGPLDRHGRGRHTTTRRQLVHLASGALVVDTPGMREVGLWLEGDGTDATEGTRGLGRAFSDILEHAADCRFGDCRHEREPGCAVLAAMDHGLLDAGRVEAFRKLFAEASRVEQQRVVAARGEGSKWAVADRQRSQEAKVLTRALNARLRDKKR